MELKPRFNLPDIEFAEKSPQQIEQDVISRYEKSRGISLGKADPRRLFIQSLIPILSQQRNVIDFSAKQNLIGYAVDEYLDHLGANASTPRLGSTYATTTIRFHFSIAQSQPINAGTRATAGDGIFFQTKEDVIVQSDQTYIDITFECTVPGEVGNGYLPGEIKQLVDPLPWVQSIENITESAGGTDVEENDPYAERIYNAPERYSTAGPEGAYEYWAKTANSTIIDVSVNSPSGGVVEVVPLIKNGEIPGQEILDQVDTTLSDKKVRPLTDKVNVIAPTKVNYDISLTYWIRSEDSSLSSTIQSKVNAELEAYKLWQKSKLGRDIDPSELIYRLKHAGAKRVDLVSPAFLEISDSQIAADNIVTVTYGGLEND